MDATRKKVVSEVTKTQNQTYDMHSLISGY